LYTKVEWASLVGLVHAERRLRQAELLGKIENVTWVHYCGDSRDAESGNRFRPLVTLEHHAGFAACVDKAGQQVEGARRGSVQQVISQRYVISPELMDSREPKTMFEMRTIIVSSLLPHILLSCCAERSVRLRVRATHSSWIPPSASTTWMYAD
jgi:hypothetical protein